MNMAKDMKHKIVLALGGNALGNSLSEQAAASRTAASAVADLIGLGNEVVLIHGNGPQVGMIDTVFKTAVASGQKVPLLPLSMCVALSQGYIGYNLQNALQCELDKRGIRKSVCTLITQVEVDPKDPAFQKPTKPIGDFLSEEQASALLKKGIAVAEDSNRGYRRVVPSPLPKDIIEKDMIATLLGAGHVPIAVGGGGIPVARSRGKYSEVPAVVDKDWAAAKLAEIIGADLLIILTSVEKVLINFGKADEQALDHLTAATARQYIQDGQFGIGSMLPKIEAALSFVSSGKNRRALITMLEKASDGMKGHTGTIVSALPVHAPR